MINLLLFITAASMVIYTYGLLSPSTAIAFFSISLCILAFAAKRMDASIKMKSRILESSENRHFFAGNYYRTFTDANGALWLRDEDIRKQIHTRYPQKVMASKYPLYFRRANPVVDAWYVHPKALWALAGNPTCGSDATVLKFLETEVIGVHYGLLLLGGKNGAIPELPEPVSRWWIQRFWNGELGLIKTIIFGAILVYGVGLTLDFLYPKEPEFVIHYQRAAAVYLASIVSTVGLLFWWGHGIILATLHWLSSGRSLRIACGAILLGCYLLIQSLTPFVKKYDQYSFIGWLSILSDKDEKPLVYYDPGLKAVIISGGLGFGTTIKLQEALQKSPQVQIIGLKSYGGRVAEGLAIYSIIRKKKLDTYAWAECMSACTTAYIAGAHRYIRNTTAFGLHRSGLHWDDEDNGISETDRLMAQLLRDNGVREWMIQRGLVPTIHDIYMPSVQDALDSNLATAFYSSK